MRTAGEMKTGLDEEVTPRPSWLPALYGFMLSAAVLLGVYWPTVVSLVELWAHSGMFQYAFLILPISLWLVWIKRHELVRAYEPSLCRPGLLLLLPIVFVWFLGQIAGVNLLQDIALVATLPVLVLIFFGLSVVRALVFPLAYLAFMIPVGQSMVGRMQTVTAEMSVKFLQLTGVPVLLEGHFITTPSTVWHVAEACSGIRFFVACTALGCLFAYLMFTNLWRRLAFIFASMIVPIIANGLRVYFTILIGENFGVKYASGTDHLIFGWQFFGTVLFLLFLVGWFLREPPQLKEGGGSRDTEWVQTSWAGAIIAAALTMLLLAAAPVAAAWVQRTGSAGSEPVAFAAPAGVSGWRGPVGAVDVDWQPQFQGANRVLKAGYVGKTSQASVFAAIYQGAPVDGHDLLAHKNILFDAERWTHASQTGRKFMPRGETSFAGHELVLTGPLRNRLIWYWYRVNGNALASPVWVKAWQAREQLLGMPLTSSLIAMSIRFKHARLKQARATLTQFMNVFYPRLDRAVTKFDQQPFNTSAK